VVFSRRTGPRSLFSVLTALLLILLILLAPASNVSLLPSVSAQENQSIASIAPSASNWGVFIGSTGDVHIGINKSGIAVRVEIPREFSAISGENDTSFIESDIRNDYYYYNVVDESKHWSYAWNGTDSVGPCYKPEFAFYDPNAPWCVDIFNYLNGSFLTFTPPKTIKLALHAPQVAGIYNFSVFVANHNNTLGFPDFVHAWNETLFIPVTMKDNPGNVTGTILDCKYTNIPILAKGIVYALHDDQVVARAYVNETTGRFRLTGLDPSIKQYDIQASAGLFVEPDGTTVAFSLTDAGMEGTGTDQGICLERAPQIWGHLVYRYSDSLHIGSETVHHALTDHPWLGKAGFNVLNITVEAIDALGTHIYRNLTVSQNSTIDYFRIITGIGWRYGGVGQARDPDPYGTEFAGLPQSAAFSIYAWVAGYNLKSPQSVTVTPPGIGSPNTGSSADVELIMLTGGAISGVLQFNFCTDPCTPLNQHITPETPFNATRRVLGTTTQPLYGGNIVVEAYDSSNTLRGITLLNETGADGDVTFSDNTTVPFLIVGFSEFFNRSLAWAGANAVAVGSDPSTIPRCTEPSQDSFCWKDAALPADSYSLKVYVRGYELKPGTPSVSVPAGSLKTLTSPVDVVEGGAIEVTVASYDNRPGTRAIQAALPWRFLNLSIPIKARVYFYDSVGNTLGYVERVMVTGTGVANGVQLYTFKAAFAGQNWNLHDVLFLAQKPDYVPSGNASASAFTLGYVQQSPGKILVPEVTLGQLASKSIVLLYGNEIGLTTPLYNDPSLYTSVPEHQHIVAEVTSKGLAGAMIENLTAGRLSPLDFPIFGFGAMIYNRTFVGLGHFFYVPRDEIANPRCSNYGFSLTDANRCFDYGLEEDILFQAGVPEYGFQRHFTQLATTLPSIQFDDLFLEQGLSISLINMAKVVQNKAVVGHTCYNTEITLSWIQVQARAAGQQLQTTTTYDGNYSLFVRGGSPYVLSFGLLTFYPQQPSPPIPLGNLTWGSTTPITPPPLDPSGGPTCDPPPSPVAPSLTVEPHAPEHDILLCSDLEGHSHRPMAASLTCWSAIETISCASREYPCA
jgi:hypothetical protein